MNVSSASLDRYLEDSSGYRGEAERVYLPSSLSELRGIVCDAFSRRIPLTIAGAGTGLTGARVPHGGWIVSLERFRKIEIQPGKARCGAGVILSDLQEEAAKTRQFLGPNPTENSASIGGIISTNAGGARGFRYGSVRHHVLALEVTLMSGETLRFQRGERVDFPIRPVRIPKTTKNSAGYPLHSNVEWVDLLSGSEGTLGIITEAELQLFAEPAAVLSGVAFFPSDDHAQNAIETWRPIPELRLLEFMDEHALDLLRPRYPKIPSDARAALFIEQNLSSEDDEEIERWTDRLREHQSFENESWFSLRASDRERFREFRHALPVMVLERVRRNSFPKFGTDFAVPLDRGRDLHNYYRRRCEEAFPGRHTIFGHAGDANNHINLLPATPEQAEHGANLIDEFARYVVSLGGTVAAEHGIGKQKTDLLKLMYSDEEIDAMRDVKRRLDPEWLLGRGTLFEV